MSEGDEPAFPDYSEWTEEQDSEDYDEPNELEGVDLAKNPEIGIEYWKKRALEAENEVEAKNRVLRHRQSKLDELRKELQDCWENQQEYKDDVAELHRQNAELRERIEEARLYLEEKRNRVDIWKVLEILSPDSDEGDAQ